MQDEAVSLSGQVRLAGLDWVVLAAYGLALVGAGWWFSRRRVGSSSEYFLAGRSMPAWAVALSALATAQSAATFIGVPEQSYAGNLTYLLGNIGPLLAAVVVARVFLPAYYRAGVGSPYELLETRFGVTARVATSWTYLLGRMLASGARTYMGALPLSLAVFGDASTQHVAMSIGVIMLVATVLTLVGGIRSVIWTDVLQVCVYMGAAVAAVVVLLVLIPAPISAIAATLQEAGKLRVLDWGVSSAGVAWGSPFTVLTACTGLMLLNLAAYATDQDLVQRSLTCTSAGQAARSVWYATLLGIPVGLVFLVIGLLLFVYYQRPELMGAARPAVVPGQSKDVFQMFILSDMPVGVRGLMIAGVLAIGPLGINATLNSMASTLMGDTIARGRARGGEVPASIGKRDVFLGRLCVVACGAVLAATSMLCVVWHQRAGVSLIEFALSIMAFAYTGLLGVFLVALLTRRGSSASVVAALVAGLVVTALLQPMVMGWIWGEKSGWPAWISALGGLASPWRMVMGTGIAVVVCLMGWTRRVN